MDNLNIRNEDVFLTRQGSTSRRPAARKQGRPSIGPGDLTPPSSGSQHEQEPPRMLMSPPPEEVLRTTRARSNESRFSSSPSKPRTPGRTPRQQSSQASKRKRVLSRAQGTSTNLTDIAERVPVASTSQVTIEATPNPRVRKQAKHELHYFDGPTTPTKSSSTRESASPTKRALLQSPHSKNPNADYLPALQEFSRDTISKHRIHTPVRPYEPPRDRFTPPREVVYTPMPSVSKSSKRKSLPGSRTKGKERRLTIQIKKEPPEIDLSAPLPPGSPTDDPLLLRGPPPSTSKRTRPPRASLIPTHARDTPPISSSSPIRAPMGDTTQLMDMTMGGVLGDSDADLYDEDAPLPPVFDFQDEQVDPIAEAEREQTPTVAGLNEEYQTLSVPTKADPPSSSTKERMDRWGRPVSPFPYQTSHSPTPVSPAGKPSGMSDTVGEEASPAHLHPTILAAADRAQTALQPSILSYEMDESEPPLSTSPPLSSTPSPSKAVPHTLIVDAHDNEELPPSDPPSPLSPQAQLDVSSSDDYYLGHDTIAEYEIPLAGDDSSSEPGDFHTDNILGSLEEQPSYAPDNDPTESIATKEHSTKATVPPVAYQQPPPSTKSAQNKTTYLTTSKPSAAAPNATFEGTTSVNSQADWSIAVDDEAEIEDAESVVRELSHEPDFRDDDAFRRLLPATPQSSRLQVASSPHNPFDSQPSAFAAHEETHMSSRLPRRPEPVMEPDVTELEMDDGAGLEDFDLGVIKITSEDPMAAARAAAILRLHRYDCLDKPPASKRTPSVLETALRNSRRKSVRESGINKSMLSSAHRRRSLGGMIGDKVVRPGTPAVTLPDLLREAEESLIMDDEGPSIILPPAPDPPPGYLDAILNTPKAAVPVTATKSALPVELNTSGPRDWTKMDWKVLDGCYTDERLSIGEKMGLTVGSLAPADQVDPESVADRFVELIGGEKVISGLGMAFTRANLLKRVRALKRKQSSGDAAPPCLSPSSKSSAQYADATQNFSMLMSPSFSFFGDFLPISKLTPRHAPPPSIPTTKQPTKHFELQRDILPPPVDSSSTASSSLDNTLPPDAVPPTPSSLAGKVKGLLYSYLPKTNKVPTASQPPQPPKGPNLPPPPPELFRKPRAAITTPLPKPMSKPPNPRELVRLNPVGRVGASKQPGVARTGQASSRSTESSTAKPVSSRERRGSNVSVKDLVKTFESLEKQHAANRDASQAVEVKRKQSNHDLKAKPVWKS